MPPTRNLNQSAVHEAGHVVVAFALGRDVMYVRIGSQPLPTGHPQAGALQGAITGAESRYGPDLREDMTAAYNSDEPYKPEHIEWLRGELITCFAGVAAEDALLGNAAPESGEADLYQAATVVNILRPTNASVEKAERIAAAILEELKAGLEQVAAKLSEGACELDESATRALLERVGLRQGSHRTSLEQIT